MSLSSSVTTRLNHPKKFPPAAAKLPSWKSDATWPLFLVTHDRYPEFSQGVLRLVLEPLRPRNMLPPASCLPFVSLRRFRSGSFLPNFAPGQSHRPVWRRSAGRGHFSRPGFGPSAHFGEGQRPRNFRVQDRQHEEARASDLAAELQTKDCRSPGRL